MSRNVPAVYSMLTGKLKETGRARRIQDQGRSLMTKTILFRVLCGGVFALFLGVFFFTPIGGAHAYRIYLQKRSGKMCAAWFCTNKATVSAYYTGDQGSGFVYYCARHADRLTPTKRGGGGVFGLVAIALFAFTLLFAIRAGFAYPVSSSLLRHLGIVFVSLALANFSIWLFPMCFD